MTWLPAADPLRRNQIINGGVFSIAAGRPRGLLKTHAIVLGATIEIPGKDSKSLDLFWPMTGMLTS